MSGRKLGGGRVLGSGKGLAPPRPNSSQSSTSPSYTPSPLALHDPNLRASSPFAGSDYSNTTVSNFRPSPANSTTISPSSSPLPDLPQDLLVSNISLAGPSNGTPTNNKLVCPICEEEMVTLLQLNRHIDDVHQELPESAQDEVKTWFDKQVLKAKRFQPLSLINQKLRGLEVFESNETEPPPSLVQHTTGPARIQEQSVIDPEELVTRKHWQRPSGLGGDDYCTDPTCGKRLGAGLNLGARSSQPINCRKCGRLFCEEHTMYQMKLSRSAAHEPVRGVWCRVCETCYKSRDGYNDHNGFTRDHTAAFTALRTKRVDRHRLEVQRLEKRLTKLTGLLAELPVEAVASGNGSGLLSLSVGQRNQRKQIEQSVVSWEEDAAVKECPFCRREFGSWTFRRHHCRICGKVVCADLETACSTEVGLTVSRQNTPSPTPPSEKHATDGQLSIDVRMCRDCKTTIFSHRDFAQSIAHKPPDQRAYETLRQFERGIRSLMPLFQKALVPLQPTHPDAPDGDVYGGKPPTHAQIQEAARIRKRLTDAFAKYDLASKRIRDMKVDGSPTQLRLQKAIYAYASSFLHTNLIPLKGVPRILKSNSSGLSSSSHKRFFSGNGPSLSPLRNGLSVTTGGDSTYDAETSSLGGASEASTVTTQLQEEEKAAREKLIVLEEQKFMVQEMLSNAHGQRRFEEVGSLSRNLEELDKEIAECTKIVEGLEKKWVGVYTSGAAS